jgi:hypothetical protein
MMTCLHSKSASYAHLAVQRALMQTRVAAVRLQVQREYFQANAPAPQLTTTMASMHNAKPARSRVCNVRVPPYVLPASPPHQQELWQANVGVPKLTTTMASMHNAKPACSRVHSVRVPLYVLPASPPQQQELSLTFAPVQQAISLRIL